MGFVLPVGSGPGVAVGALILVEPPRKEVHQRIGAVTVHAEDRGLPHDLGADVRLEHRRVGDTLVRGGTDIWVGGPLI